MGLTYEPYIWQKTARCHFQAGLVFTDLDVSVTIFLKFVFGLFFFGVIISGFLT